MTGTEPQPSTRALVGLASKHGPKASIGSRRALRKRGVDARRLLIGLDGVMAINAMAGAWYAVSGAPDVPIEWLDGTPFGGYVVPGLILGGAVGVSQLSARLKP